jgi:hypothetical protein
VAGELGELAVVLKAGEVMQEYLLRVAPSAQSEVAKFLKMSTAPSHVRLSTLAPLSNYGHPANSESAILGVSETGVVTGQFGDDKAPHDFIPWQNIAFMADGALLAKDRARR